MPDRFAQHRELVAAVAPELAVDPVYVYDLPDGIVDRGIANAFASSTMANTMMRPHLEDAGQWRGPGHHIVFCRELEPDQELAITGHEAAHLLPRRQPVAFDDIIEPEDRAEILVRVSAKFAGFPAHKPRWRSEHGAGFIRRCIHIGHRAAMAGLPISSAAMTFAGETYELRHHTAYIIALGDEPERLADKTFAEIAATPPPPAFRKLFIADACEWYQKHAPTN